MSAERTPGHTPGRDDEYAPEFLNAYDRLRKPLDRKLVAARRKAERRIRRRRPWSFLDRGDEVVEQRPLPVVELRSARTGPVGTAQEDVAALDSDAATITRMLVARSANHPVAVLAECENHDPDEALHAGSRAAADVLRTEADVKALVGEFARRRTKVLRADRKSPDPLEFPRTESLLALFRVFGEQAETSGHPPSRWLTPQNADDGLRNSPEIAEALRSRAADEYAEALRRAQEEEPDRSGGSVRSVWAWAVRVGQGILGSVGWLVYRFLYTGLYTLINKVWEILGKDREDSSAPTFDWFDQKVMTPLGFVVNLLLGSFFLLGVQNIPSLETIEQIFAVIVFSCILLLRALVYLCWNHPWRPYRWLAGQPYLRSDGGETSFFSDHRLVAQQAGRAYQSVVYGPPDAKIDKKRRAERGTRARQLRLLLVNAVLSDLADSYPKRRYRTAFDRPALIADRTATRWNGVEGSPARRVDLVETIEEIRTTQYAPDPLVIVTILPGAAETRPSSAASADTERKEGDGSLTAALTDWAVRRHRITHVGPSRTVTWDLGAAAAERAVEHGRVRGRNAEVRTPGRRRRDVAVRSLVSLIVLAPMVGAVWAVDESNGECWRPMIQHRGVWGAEVSGGSKDKDCVGFTDGSFPFDPRLESIQDQIKEQNDAVTASKDPYVTVVYFGQMSVPDPNADNSRLAGVQGELAGLALRQRMHNADARSQGNPLLRLLLANTGPRWEHGAEVAEKVGAELRKDESIMAAVGFGQSLTTTTATIGALSRFGLPMISSTATYDDIARIDEERHTAYFFPIAPSNTRLARQAAQWAWWGADSTGAEESRWKLEPSKTAVAVADNSSVESYGVDLATSFMSRFTALGGLAKPASLPDTAGDGFVPGVIPYGEEGRPGLRDVVREICADPPEIIYYAGRSAEFGGFLNDLQETGRCPDGVRVLGSDDIAQYATDNLTHLKDVYDQTPVYSTPLAASGTWGLTGEGGDRPFYVKFHRLTEELSLAQEINVTTDKDMVKGPSVAHAAMAYDTLTVVSDAIDRAQRAQYGANPSGELPSGLFSAIQQTKDLVGISGTLAFNESGHGYWFDEKLVQLVLSGPEDTQHVVAACGQITFQRSGPGPNCLD